jgi:hypothetical protein
MLLNQYTLESQYMLGFFLDYQLIVILLLSIFSYNETGLCEMANLTFLEDPNYGETAKQVMVNVNVANQIPMYCRGGEHCCNKDTNCTVGDGDCNTNEDCPGALICGTNNCLTGRAGHVK